MKVLLLSVFDTQGGAARAAYRLHKGLQSMGTDSKMFVQYKMSDDPSVHAKGTKIAKGIALLRPELDSLPLRLYGKRPGALFSPQWLPDSVLPMIESLRPDVINLHWICGGFIRIETIARFRQPLVWTLHDCWPFTGGCHYPFDCPRYAEACGMCPQLLSRKTNDLSNRIWKRKNTAWRNVPISIVTPSHWLAGCAKSSSLFRDARIQVIPNGLDITRYKPTEKKLARSLLNLPLDKTLLLLGSDSNTKDPRKGFQYLKPTLGKMGEAGWRNKMGIMIFGSSHLGSQEQLGYETHMLGILRDDISLSLAYSAADAFIAPSVQDNLPNTVMESLACGTPCVAFDIGGMRDMIEHGKNGYLAKPFDDDDLGRGIAWIVENDDRRHDLSLRARLKVEEEFSLEVVARRYADLYDELFPLQPDVHLRPGGMTSLRPA